MEINRYNTYIVSFSSLLDLCLVDGELDGAGGRLSSQVVHTGLQTQLPAVEMHRAHLSKVGFGNVDVKGLRLVDEGASVGRLLKHHLLADLPHGFVQLTNVLRDALK